MNREEFEAYARDGIRDPTPGLSANRTFRATLHVSDFSVTRPVIVRRQEWPLAFISPDSLVPVGTKQTFLPRRHQGRSARAGVARLARVARLPPLQLALQNASGCQ